MYQIEIELHKEPMITKQRGSFERARREVIAEAGIYKGRIKEVRIIYIPHWSIVWRQEYKLQYQNKQL